MSKQNNQKLYEEFISDFTSRDKNLKDVKKEIQFKTSQTVLIKTANRASFKEMFEQTLKKEKVPFTSSIVSGSSFESTIIDFSKLIPSLKKLTIQYKPGGGTFVKAKTAWQELGAEYIFKRSLVDDINYTEKLNKSLRKNGFNTSVLSKKILPESVLLDIFDDDMPELKKIFHTPANSDFPYVEWLNSFYFSQKVLLEKYSNSTFTSFNREGGFMQYISNLVNKKFNIIRKDTWNPADVWAIRGTEREVEKYINDRLSNVMDYKEASTKFEGARLEEYVRAGILKLNSILIDLLTGTNPKVVGISLKLTDSGAHIEEVNFDKVSDSVSQNKLLIDTISDSFEVIPKNDFYCNFSIPPGKQTFTQDVRIDAKDKKNQTSYNFQIKANSSESQSGSNLKFELTIKGKSSARGGKVPVELVVELVNKIKRGAFVNEYQKYPRSSKEFLDNLESGKNYKEIFSVVSKNCKDIGVNYEEFIFNVKKSFDAGGATKTNATCKLMGMEFLYFLITIGENEMRSLITDMSFLAQKKNIRNYDTFGPFIKIS